MNLYMPIIYHFSKEGKVIFVSVFPNRVFRAGRFFSHSIKLRRGGKERQVIHIINILFVDNFSQIVHKTKPSTGSMLYAAPYGEP